jgi:hypothetical protein
MRRRHPHRRKLCNYQTSQPHWCRKPPNSRQRRRHLLTRANPTRWQHQRRQKSPNQCQCRRRLHLQHLPDERAYRERPWQLLAQSLLPRPRRQTGHRAYPPSPNPRHHLRRRRLSAAPGGRPLPLGLPNTEPIPMRLAARGLKAMSRFALAWIAQGMSSRSRCSAGPVRGYWIQLPRPC